MTAPRSTDQLLQAFLADGITELPDRSYATVRREIHGVRQRGAPWPRLAWPIGWARWLSVAILAAVVVALAALDLRPQLGPGSVQSPAPSASAARSPSESSPGSAGQPTTFVSPLYGYRVTAPAGWLTAAAVLRWDGSIEPGPFAETDKFAGPGSLMAWAYSGPFTGDLVAFVADRIAATHRDHADTCPVVEPEVNEPLDVHGQPWRLLAWNCGALINEAVTVRAGRAYVFVFRDLGVQVATEPADRAVFDSILESIVLPN